MKICTKCKENKPLIDFAKDKKRPDGLNVYCRLCEKNSHNKAKSATYHKNRRQDPVYIQARKDAQAKHYAKRKEDPDMKLRLRGQRLKSRYWPHLTGQEALQEYDRMLISQDYKCKICRVHQDEFKLPLAVDHCHSTLKVRGLLCTVCNKDVIGGIDQRMKAKKVKVTMDEFLANIKGYYE